MLLELLAMAQGHSARPRARGHLGARIAVVGAMLSMFCVSVILLFVALGVWLVSSIGKAPALASLGAAGLLLATLGLLIAGHRRAPRLPPVSVAPQSADGEVFSQISFAALTKQYPLEAVILAAAAGVLAATAQGAALSRPIVDAVLRAALRAIDTAGDTAGVKTPTASTTVPQSAMVGIAR